MCMRVLHTAVLFTAWAAVSVAANRAAETRAAEPKIVIVNDDGFSSFHSGTFRTKEDLQRFVHQFQGTDVTAVEWCLGTGGQFIRSNSPQRSAATAATPARGDTGGTAWMWRLG